MIKEKLESKSFAATIPQSQSDSSLYTREPCADSVRFVKKKPVSAYDFESAPRARKNVPGSCLDGEVRRARFRSQGGKYYCDGKVFEGEGALRAVWQYIWTMNFIRRKGASI